MLAAELKNEGIAFLSNPIIQLSACLRYTVDFLIWNKLIVEVDGGIHDREYRKTPDRIRQRALEKLGYFVYRVRNEVVYKSPWLVTDEILQNFYQAFDTPSDTSKPVLSKVTKTKNIFNYNPTEDLLISVAIRINEHPDYWEKEKFRMYLSEIDPSFLTKPCFTERLILTLMGFGIKTKSTGQLDFNSFLDIFVRGLNIMSHLYGDQGKIYLTNTFSITAAGFMKNLIFHGGPKIRRGTVKINDASSLNDQIAEFNKCFSSVSIFLDINDVKVECQRTLKIISPTRRDYFSWVSHWVEN